MRRDGSEWIADTAEGPVKVRFSEPNTFGVLDHAVTLRLAEANPVSGSLRFELPEGSYGGPRAGRSDRVRRPLTRGRPALATSGSGDGGDGTAHASSSQVIRLTAAP